jgi:hypothetical protein
LGKLGIGPGEACSQQSFSPGVSVIVSAVGRGVSVLARSAFPGPPESQSASASPRVPLSFSFSLSLRARVCCTRLPQDGARSPQSCSLTVRVDVSMCVSTDSVKRRNVFLVGWQVTKRLYKVCLGRIECRLPWSGLRARRREQT